jgi:tetraacyldisaccharide-1-P 4'-kinase
LFVSAGETVTRDLTALVVDKEDAEAHQVTFPVEHLRAWMSALNQVRLILGEVHKINEEDMNRADFDPQSPKHMAALRIHLLGYLLQMFVELETGDESKTSV